ncbi:MAG: hypothetical protein DRJ49_02365 [Thermoprotei archaeon]|nr:MAG: hypothetical protein DRJ49_02365 [Thermoprotei archaeon]
MQVPFFIYDLLGFKYELGPLGPYSKEVEESIIRLQQMDLIKVLVFGTTRVYTLTERGKKFAKDLVRRIRDEYILLNEVVIMKGKEVLDDLTKLKSSLNDKSEYYLVYKCLQRLADNTNPYFNRKLSLLEWTYLNEALESLKNLMR